MTKEPAEGSYEKALADYYRSRIRLAQNHQFFGFVFGHALPEQGAVSALRARLPMSDGSSLWFSGSLASPAPDTRSHVHQFIGTYDSSDLALTEAVASAAHYDLKVARLGYGHTFPLASRSSLRERALESLLVLQAGIDPLFHESAPPEALRTTLFFLVPITGAELALKRDHGLNALFDRWSDERRSPFSIPLATGPDRSG